MEQFADAPGIAGRLFYGDFDLIGFAEQTAPFATDSIFDESIGIDPRMWLKGTDDQTVGGEGKEIEGFEGDASSQIY